MNFKSFKNKIQKHKRTNFQSNLIIIISIVIFNIGIIKLLDLEAYQITSLKNSFINLIYWLQLFYFILLLSYLGRYLRWRILIGSLSVGETSFKDLLWWFSGFSLTATPGKIGEITRVHQLNKYLGYPKDILLPTFFVERFFDFFSVLIWLLILSPKYIFIYYQELISSKYFLIFTIFILIISIFLFKKLFKYSQLKWTDLKSKIPKKKILKSIIFSTLTSMFFWAIEALILWLLVYVLSNNVISISSAICIYFISGILGVLSGLPGGIGINEATTTILLQQEGLPGTLALIISILRRLITIWSISGISILLSIKLKRHIFFKS